MPDTYTQVTTTGYFSRIINSIVGVFFGILLIIGAFLLLWWNEGRIDISTIAKKSTVISATNPQSSSQYQNQLISTTGNLSTSELLGDNLYIKPDKYVAISRKVEMFAWVEHSQSKTRSNFGGSQTTTTTYTYTQQWTDNPFPPSSFKEPSGHENPTKTIPNTLLKVTNAKIGDFDLEMSSIDLITPTKLELSTQNTLATSSAALTNPDYFFIGKGTLDTPQIGDIRISYNVLPLDTESTAFGKLEGTKITPYFYSGTNKLYELFPGTRDEAIVSYHEQFVTLLWILRGVGTFMMIFGLLLALGPIATVLDFIPIIGGVSGFLIIVAVVPIALVLSLLTILISKIFHHPLALIATIFFVIGLLIFGHYLKSRRKKENIPQNPQPSTQNQPAQPIQTPTPSPPPVSQPPQSTQS